MGVETIIGGALGGIGSVAGAAIGSSGAQSAAEAQAAAMLKSAEIQRAANRDSIQAQEKAAGKAESFLREQAGIARQDLAPLRAAQTQAIQQLQGLSQEGNPLEVRQRQAATQQIQRQLAAQGLLRSKNQVDLLSGLELGLAEQRTGVLSGLAGLGALQSQANIAQGLGQGLAQIQGGLGAGIGSSFQQLGAQLGQNQMQVGQIFGQNALAQAQALQGGLAGVNNSIQGILQSSLAQKQRASDQEFLTGLVNKGGLNALSALGGFGGMVPLIGSSR